jgi:hypothetical protein
MNSFFNEYKSRGIYILYVLLWLVLLIIKLIEFTTAIDIKYSVAYIIMFCPSPSSASRILVVTHIRDTEYKIMNRNI